MQTQQNNGNTLNKYSRVGCGKPWYCKLTSSSGVWHIYPPGPIPQNKCRGRSIKHNIHLSKQRATVHFMNCSCTHHRYLAKFAGMENSEYGKRSKTQ